jgi:GxxExxY protein
MIKSKVEKIASEIVDSIFTIHKSLGPGLLESAYQHCLAYELASRELNIQTERPLPLVYKEVKLDCGYRLDIVVENQILIEIKSVDGLAPIQMAQIITYLKLSEIKLGFLVNFNVPLIKDGIRRVVNNY